MYNEKIKQQYLDYLNTTNNKNAIARIPKVFNELELLEIEYDEDLFVIPKSIIAEYLAINAKSLTTMTNKMTLINRYKEWANNNGLIPDDYKAFAFEKCNLSETFYKYNTTQIFRTPSELRRMLDENFPTRRKDSITLDELASAYLMLIYQGFKDDEVFAINVENVIVKSKSVIISMPDKDIAVYDEFKMLLSRVYQIRNYMCLSNNDLGIKTMGDRFIDNGRGLSNKQIKIDIDRNINRKIKHINCRISDIYLMGMVFRKKIETNDNFDVTELLIEYCGSKYKEAAESKLKNILKKW